MTWLVTLDWPSVWGRNAELRHNWVPKSLNISCHTRLVKTGSRSLTIKAKNLWRRTMLVKKAVATVVTEYGCPSAMKWPYLEKRSMTVSTTNLPPTLGKPSMKYIVMSVHTASDMMRG
jgi:hypothetical protein